MMLCVSTARSLFLLKNIPSCGHHSPGHGPLFYFQSLAITKKATVNSHVQSLCGHMLSFILGKYQGVGLLGHVAGA